MIYLATAYSYNPAVAHARAVEVLAALLKHGVPVFSPIAHHHEAIVRANLGTSWEVWGEYDRQAIDVCDEVWVWRDPEGHWRKSRGVLAEMEYADARRKPVRFVWFDDPFWIVSADGEIGDDMHEAKRPHTYLEAEADRLRTLRDRQVARRGGR